MIDGVGIWGHALAATLFVALALWRVRAAAAPPGEGAFVAALTATGFWALVAAFSDPASIAAAFAETLRNFVWLGWLFALTRPRARDGRRLAISALFGVVAAVGLLELPIALLPAIDAGAPGAAIALRLIGTIGALMLVHTLYTAAAPDARDALRLPLIALAALWSYDLQLYAVAALSPARAAQLLELRGLVALLTAPVFGVALRRSEQWKMRLSRTVAFQSLSLIAILGYLSALGLATLALGRLEGEAGRLAQVALVFGTTLAALVFLPSDRFRAWAKVKLAKHFFQHRYDYREEWLRFMGTLGAPGGEAPLGERVIRALADITDSPAGLLLGPDEAGGLVVQAGWNWGPTGGAPLAPDTAAFFAETGRILTVADEPVALPEWLAGDPRLWALVPLPHYERLAGLVCLARPPIDRGLDWEDFDLLRIAGRQAGSYLSEARGQEALSDARRFDEFNRRFAFILHDIKNLVSQLSLVARNAERHADNPEFRADMIATLNDSAGKMSELLARLAPHARGRAEAPRPVAALAFARGLAARHRARAIVAGDDALLLLADPAGLEQAFCHLVQNAIDASPPDAPVTITVQRRGLDGAIEIVDQGPGMSAEFVRTQLFRPFASTKDGGFGIGAYEARALIAGMGGRIEVESHEGVGSRFTIVLPRAAAELAA